MIMGADYRGWTRPATVLSDLRSRDLHMSWLEIEKSKLLSGYL